MRSSRAVMHLQKTGPCQIHPCRGLCGHLHWEQVTSGSSLSPTNWQRRAKQILQLTAAGIFLQNCLCKKGRVLGVLPLGGTKPSIVRAPAEATCGKRSRGMPAQGSSGVKVGPWGWAVHHAAGWWWCPGEELLLVGLGWIWDGLN